MQHVMPTMEMIAARRVQEQGCWAVCSLAGNHDNNINHNSIHDHHNPGT